MGPVAALRSCLSKSFQWRGRAARAEFWWFFVIFYGGLIVTAIYTILSVESGDDVLWPPVVFLLGLFPASLAVMARRLHDKGLTTWLVLLGVVPFGQLALLILAVLPGDEGPNGYGDDPLGRAKPEGLTYGSSRVPLVRDND
ncbi:Uncharacterized membrane protein YhaH, DUF805 family [Litoreibacter ascidiaceicola]|uniref:Uncharacterized membrane protein YhaH, DUF805 family n=1 Tax=Litoreibacter ascidiaceicola TaxID=1486859 RepID=A0A1M5CAF3_9RHOB|nr:DUF805 domain-containing protein [Litoreibacter ascidiaceicola]SHF51744.1 Uncharacterized membrane protein YhaH, DUF805 family [Litoreibacter ascidiaceicola]